MDNLRKGLDFVKNLSVLKLQLAKTGACTRRCLMLTVKEMVSVSQSFYQPMTGSKEDSNARSKTVHSEGGWLGRKLPP